MLTNVYFVFMNIKCIDMYGFYFRKYLLFKFKLIFIIGIYLNIYKKEFSQVGIKLNVELFATQKQ